MIDGQIIFNHMVLWEMFVEYKCVCFILGIEKQTDSTDGFKAATSRTLNSGQKKCSRINSGQLKDKYELDATGREWS